MALPACRGDIHLLEQALINLMTNAAQAMEGQEGEQRIELSSSFTGSAAEDGYHVAVSVADSGPGIPKEVRDKIFDPFFTTKRSGTGIGLSITHKIITDHGGFLRVETSRWGGALFTIVLPAMPSGMSSNLGTRTVRVPVPGFPWASAPMDRSSRGIFRNTFTILGNALTIADYE